MPSETTESVVAELREGYTLLRQMHSPYYRPGPQDEKQWARLAATLARNGIPHRQYLKWAYEFYADRYPVPFVNMIASDKTVKIFLERESFMADQEADTRLKCELQQDTLAVELQKGRTPREIVEDSSLELGVVFRYAVAHSAGLRGLVDRLRDQVARELHFNPHYREVLGSFLPD